MLWGDRPLSMRRLRSLIVGLPIDGCFFRATQPDASWTQTHELLATLIEVTDRVHLRHLSALGAKRLPKGIDIARPHVKPKAKRKATSEDMRRIFGDVRYKAKEVSDA